MLGQVKKESSVSSQTSSFLVTHGPLIAAILTGMFTAVTPFLGREGITKSQKFLKIIVATVAVSVLVVGYLILSTYWEPKNVWSEWSDNIENEIFDCKNENVGDVECVKRALDIYTDSEKMPSMSGRKDSTASKFYYDIKAGESLINIPLVSDVFYYCFGIDSDSFIGSGSTIPWNENADYRNADAREFIISNFHETKSYVWTWEFKPDSSVTPDLVMIKDLITDTDRFPPTKESSKIPISSRVKYIVSQNKTITADAPVIRFQRFLKSRYEGTLGRPGAFKVFSVSLQDVWEMNLQNAMRASGFTRNVESDDETLFVWLYLPGIGGEVIPATWGNVLSKASKWLEEGIKENPDNNNHCKPKRSS